MRAQAHAALRRGPGLWVVVLYAIFLTQGALASSYVRFANASIQPERSATVEIRLDGISAVAALAYKAHTPYIERASGNAVVSVWRGNSLLLQRTVALRDGNQYLFLVYGGGATGKPYDLYPLYEGSLPIASNAAPIEYFQLAPYPWVVNSIGFSLSCLAANGQTTRDTATRSYPSNFPIEIGGDALKTLTPAPGNCVANIATAIANQVRTGAIEVEFTPTTGSRHHVVAVGDGSEQTPVEVWVFSQPARILEGPPRDRGGFDRDVGSTRAPRTGDQSGARRAEHWEHCRSADGRVDHRQTALVPPGRIRSGGHAVALEFGAISGQSG